MVVAHLDDGGPPGGWWWSTWRMVVAHSEDGGARSSREYMRRKVRGERRIR